MSSKIMGQVWDLALPHSKQSILLAMADHADHQGNNVYPSIGLVAWKTGYSTRQVQRIIQELVAEGLLILVQSGSIKGSIGIPNKYRIDISAGKMKAPYKNREKATRDIVSHPNDNQTPDKMSQGVGHSYVTPTPDIAMSPEPSLQPSDNHQNTANAVVAPINKNDETQENPVYELISRRVFHLTREDRRKSDIQATGVCARIGMIVKNKGKMKDGIQSGQGLINLRFGEKKPSTTELLEFADELDRMLTWREKVKRKNGIPLEHPRSAGNLWLELKEFRELPQKHATTITPLGNGATLRDGIAYDATGKIIPPVAPPRLPPIVTKKEPEYDF